MGSFSFQRKPVCWCAHWKVPGNEMNAITNHLSGQVWGWVRSRIPLLQELRLYSRGKFRRDLIAGATLTLVSIPQAIGFALILGVPATPVIIAVVVGGFVGALFFSSHHHVFGPTTSVCLITAGAVSVYPNLGLHPLQLAAYLAFLIGVTQFIAGLCSLGMVSKFISRSVVVGYTTAISVLLITSQLHHWLGFSSPAGETFVAALRNLAVAIAVNDVSWWAVGVGLFTLLAFEGIKRWRPAWPETLIGLAILGCAVRVVASFHPDIPFHLVKDEGALSALLPGLNRLPPWRDQWMIMQHLAGSAIAIGIIGMLEAAAVTKSLASRSGQRINPNQELLGMGAANMAGSFFGAPPGSSSFTRSVVNYHSGAATQLSAVFCSAGVLLVMLFVTPIINYIPVAALAVLLMRVGWQLMNRAQIRVATHSTKSDAIVFFVTLLAALLLRLDTAIYVGIGVALALFLRKTSTPTLTEYTFNESGQLAALPDKVGRTNPQISIIHVEGELFFGAADLFQDEVRRLAEDSNISVFILRMKNARHLDASTVMALEYLHDYLRQTQRHLLISGCNPDVSRVLRNSGLLQRIGEENIFPAEANPTTSTKRALQRARLLLQGKADIRIFYDRGHGEYQRVLYKARDYSI